MVEAIGAIEEFDGDDVEPLGEADDAAAGMDAAPGEDADADADSESALAEAAEDVALRRAGRPSTDGATADLFNRPGRRSYVEAEHEAALPASRPPTIPTPMSSRPKPRSRRTGRAVLKAPPHRTRARRRRIDAGRCVLRLFARAAHPFRLEDRCRGALLRCLRRVCRSGRPEAAAINGVPFTELAERFNLDPDGKIRRASEEARHLVGQDHPLAGRRHAPAGAGRPRRPADLYPQP